MSDTTAVAGSAGELELTILMPCLNEAETLATCIKKAKAYLARSGVAGEVLIADNGSTDGSQEIATGLGARVVPIAEKGYGAALLGGIAAARGRFVIMGDSDDSYDFSALEGFVAKLRDGYELVMGNRFRGGVAPGAMPWKNRYIGNPVLSGVGRLFFASAIRDFHCGLRGFSRAAILNLGLCTPGMEFASEMVVKATLNGLKIAEVPTTLSRDGRSRPPHLKPWRDGWRHLRFLLMYSPRWLFFYPGATLAGVGAVLTTLLALFGSLRIGGVTFEVHTLVVAVMMTLLGVQSLTFGLLAKQYGVHEGFLPSTPNLEAVLKTWSLERFVVLGGVLLALGLAGLIVAVAQWGHASFGALNYADTMRLVAPSAGLLGVGFQMVLAGFVSGILRIRQPRV